MAEESNVEMGAGFTPSELAELSAPLSAIWGEGARLPEPVLALSGVEAAPKN